MQAVRHIIVFFAVCFIGGCVSPQDASPGRPLEGTLWRLMELNGKLATANATAGLSVPTLQLNAESHRASGVSGINRYSSGYEVSGSSVKFGTVAGTRMAGPPEAMAVETAYINALANVTSWVISRDQLVLKSGDKEILQFQAE